MREGFWNAVFRAREAGAMAEKYAWLRAAVLEADGPPEPAVLREAARRWPGSLRECQRVEPSAYRTRERWACDGAVSSDRARAAWLAEGQAAVCLWSELYRLTADVLAFRWELATRARGRYADPGEFLRDLTRRDPERRAAWPEASVLGTLAPAGMIPSIAEAWLALQAGWARATLRACLLGLEGA